MSDLVLPAASRSRRGLRRDWLGGPVPDLAMLLGAPTLALVAGLLVGIDRRWLPALILVDIWLLGYHHVVATFTKLAGTAEDRRRHRFLLYGLPWVVLGATALVAATAGIWLVATVYFFWQWFHYTRQSYGIERAYRRRSGGISWDSPRLSEATLWSVPVLGILYRSAQHPARFLGFGIWMPRVPWIIVEAVGAATAALVALWVAERIAAWRRGELPLAHTLYLASHFAVFCAGYVLVDDIDQGWLAVNVWHNAQYIAFVWIYNRGRFAAGVRDDARVLSWLSQAGARRAALYFGACLGVTLVAYRLIAWLAGAITVQLRVAVLTVLLVAVMAVNFHHYVADALIWRRRAGAAPAG